MYIALIRYVLLQEPLLLAGLIQPQLVEDGQVRVDMGPPILRAAEVPTTLGATQVCLLPSQ